MKVILKERVRALGNIGEIVDVAPGHARNYLLPRHLAVVADEKNARYVEDQQRRLARKMKLQVTDAQEMKKRLTTVELEFFRLVGGNGKLFGAVSAADLSQALSVQGLDVEKKHIHLEGPIKQLGTFTVPVKLFGGVDASFRVKVVMDPKQSEEIQEKQRESAKKRKAAEEAPAAAVEGTSADSSDEESEGGMKAPELPKVYDRKRDRDQKKSKKSKI